MNARGVRPFHEVIVEIVESIEFPGCDRISQTIRLLTLAQITSMCKIEGNYDEVADAFVKKFAEFRTDGIGILLAHIEAERERHTGPPWISVSVSGTDEKN